MSSGRTAHAEAVEVVYDPAKITYAQLLGVFWRNIDPLTRNQQFCDRGAQYRRHVRRPHAHRILDARDGRAARRYGPPCLVS